MPEQVNNAAPASEFISNSLDDMVVGSIGPDQADVRVNICEYVSFDYAGTRENDPVVAVHMNLTPLDGSNDGKDFDAEWTVGPKMKDFDIFNDGGNLKPKGARHTLAPNSNWGELLKAMKDCAFDSNVLNGAQGIRLLVGTEMTIRRIAQKEREGLTKKSDKAQTFYTCMKITKMPGEKGTTRRPQQAPAASTSSAPATTAATAGGNGAGGDDSIIGFIKAALAENGNRLNIAVDLPKAVFKQAKPTHGAKGATDMGTKAKSEDFLYEHAMEQGWTIADGVLSA